MLNPLLEEQRPSWLTKVAITKLELGPRPPTLEGIKVFPPVSSSTSSSSSAAAAAAARENNASAGASSSSSSSQDRAVGGAGTAVPGQKVPPSQQSDAVVLEVDFDWAGSQGKAYFFLLSFLFSSFSTSLCLCYLLSMTDKEKLIKMNQKQHPKNTPKKLKNLQRSSSSSTPYLPSALLLAPASSPPASSLRRPVRSLKR